MRSTRIDGAALPYLLAVIVALLLVFVCVSKDSWRSSEDRERIRAHKLATLRKEVCGVDWRSDSFLRPLIREMTGHDVFVDPLVWARTEYSQRRGLAGWASVCQFDGRMAFIKHGNTGRTLATWDVDLGYDGKE